MRNLLTWLGAAAVTLWTVGGLAAWMLAGEGLTLVFQEGAPEHAARAVEVDPLEEVLVRLDRLLEVHAALAGALEENLSVLDERQRARSEELERTLEDGLAASRAELTALSAALAEVARARDPGRDPARSGPGPAPPAGPAVAVERAAPEPDAAAETAPPASESDPEPAAAPRSFLAFRLPSDDFRFDERRAWRIDPSRSRVGFDAKSTLHDFSGLTSELAGELGFDLSRPGEAPSGEVRVRTASLSTGNEGRDEAMLEHLEAERHAELAFRVERFEPARVDAAAGTVEGTVHGTMRVRGVERALSMPVVARLDAARRLSIEGQAPLSLPDYEVPVPDKFGVISMEPEVVIWIALRAELRPRAELPPRSER